jgi:hypothetical protein
VRDEAYFAPFNDVSYKVSLCGVELNLHSLMLYPIRLPLDLSLFVRLVMPVRTRCHQKSAPRYSESTSS